MRAKKVFPLLEVPVEGRVCVLCREFFISLGELDYSEYTPGYPGRAECYKGRWELNPGSTNSEFRQVILKAERCPDYKEVEK